MSQACRIIADEIRLRKDGQNNNTEVTDNGKDNF